MIRKYLHIGVASDKVVDTLIRVRQAGQTEHSHSGQDVKGQSAMATTYDRRWVMSLILIGVVFGTGLSLLKPAAAHAGTIGANDRAVLLPDDRLVRGTVQEVRSGQIQVNIGELMPVVLSVEAAREKGMPSLQRGDKLTIVVSAKNEFVDLHLADQSGWDRVLKGSLIQPMVGDQPWTVIRTALGVNEPFEVAEGARQTVLNMPIGVPALYLFNKANIIIDTTVGNERALLATIGAVVEGPTTDDPSVTPKTPAPRTGADHDPVGRSRQL